jgi:hypothetical protein
MNRLVIFLILLGTISVLFISSCSHCACDKGFLNVNLVSFVDSEAIPIILLRFNKNSGFQRPIDSLEISNIDSYRGDTLFVPTSNYLSSLNDYELYFPTANITIQISDIVEAQQEQNCGGSLGSAKTECVDQILSYKQNGILSQVYSNNTIYITK